MRESDENPEAWKQRASCRGMGTELFFPEQHGGNVMTNYARQVCAECPVQRECLGAGMGEYFGIWGGHSERERRRLRRNSPILFNDREIDARWS